MGTGSSGSLKELISEVLVEHRQVPPLDDNSILRVSSLAGLCAREEALCSRLKRTRTDTVSSDLSLIFEHGNGLHWDLQNRILPLTKTLFGRWLCGSCGARHGGQDEWLSSFSLEEFSKSQILRPSHCPNCSSLMTSDNSLYVEQMIQAPGFRLSGHPDGFIRLPGFSGLGVLEIKSISPKGSWEVRNCAKLDHVVQAQCYMWMTGIRWGLILYWDKGTPGKKGLIDHIVEYDDSQVEAIQRLITDIWDGVSGGKLPQRICESETCKRASLCSSAVECFREID